MYLTLCILLAAQHVLAGQGRSSLPSVTIVTLDGETVNAASLSNDGKPFVMSFWATWCRPCIQELNAIDEIYHEWRDHGFVLFAVSTDDARTRPNVLPMVKGRGWDYGFYLDENGDFRRAMGVTNLPHTFILNGAGEVVHQHTTFSEGMEWEMFDLLLDLLEE